MRGREIHAGLWWRSMKEKPLGRSRRRCKDIIKTKLKEIEWVI
jgi:hypothetical protein